MRTIIRDACSHPTMTSPRHPPFPHLLVPPIGWDGPSSVVKISHTKTLDNRQIAFSNNSERCWKTYLQGQEHISSHTKLHSQHPSPLYNIKTHTATQRHHKAAIPSNTKCSLLSIATPGKQGSKPPEYPHGRDKRPLQNWLVRLGTQSYWGRLCFPGGSLIKEHRPVSLNFYTLCMRGGVCHGRPWRSEDNLL